MAEETIKYNGHDRLFNGSTKSIKERPDRRTCNQCGYKCAKTFVIIFNIFFWLLGWLLIGVGVTLKSHHPSGMDDKFEQYTTAASEDNTGYNSAAELCLCVGSITVIIVLLSCYGVNMENRGILGCYIGIIVIILCLEIGAIVITSLYRENVEQRIIRDIKFTMNVYEQPNFEAVTKSIDSFQKTFACCGCDSYLDWYNSTWGKRHPRTVPSSCLKKVSFFPVLLMQDKNTSKTFVDVNTKGCFEYVRNYFVKNLYFLGSFVAWTVGVQVVGLISSVFLFHKIKKRVTTEIVCRYERISSQKQ